jgi:hypothetical protein
MEDDLIKFPNVRWPQFSDIEKIEDNLKKKMQPTEQLNTGNQKYIGTIFKNSIWTGLDIIVN